MFSFIVGGPIDPLAAGLALAVLFITLCIFCTSMVVKRRSRRAIEIDFELEKIKLSNAKAVSERQLQNQRDIELGNIASKREIEFKRIDGNALEHSAAVNDQ